MAHMHEAVHLSPVKTRDSMPANKPIYSVARIEVIEGRLEMS